MHMSGQEVRKNHQSSPGMPHWLLPAAPRSIALRLGRTQWLTCRNTVSRNIPRVGRISAPRFPCGTTSTSDDRHNNRLTGMTTPSFSAPLLHHLDVIPHDWTRQSRAKGEANHPRPPFGCRCRVAGAESDALEQLRKAGGGTEPEKSRRESQSNYTQDHPRKRRESDTK